MSYSDLIPFWAFLWFNHLWPYRNSLCCYTKWQNCYYPSLQKLRIILWISNQTNLMVNWNSISFNGGGTPTRETGDGPNFAHLPGGRREIRKYWTISHLGDGRWLALSGGGRSSRNAEGDRRKTKKVSGRWETVVFTYKNHFERRCDVPFHSFHQPEMLKGKCKTSFFPYVRRRGIPWAVKQRERGRVEYIMNICWIKWRRTARHSLFALTSMFVSLVSRQWRERVHVWMFWSCWRSDVQTDYE